jgi:zinc and cadmium transporter
MKIVFVIIALLAGSIGSVLLAALMLLMNTRRLETLATYLTYLAGGTLLGVAFLGLFPEGTGMINGNLFFQLVLAGILFFFILEKIILWRTGLNDNCERHIHASVPMVLIGDAFHSATDGIVIAASFLTSTQLGLFVTLSVVFHEIPHKLGDFGIILKGGLSIKKSFIYSMYAGAAALVAGIAAWFFMGSVQSLIPYALAFSAASFLYIAMADLIPEMHKINKVKDSVLQVVLIIAGILIIYFLKRMENNS